MSRELGAGPSALAVNTQHLRPVGRRPPLRAYVRQLWERRHFIVADSRARVGSGTRQMVLGNVWLVLRPVLDGFAFLVIFGLILKSDRGIDNFIGFLLIGVFMFQYTSRCLTTGASSVTSGRNLVRSFRFPRASLPLAAVLRETISMGPVVFAMIALILVIPPHAPVTWRWLLFPAVFALQLAFNTGLALLAARLVHVLPDIYNVISFLTRFWLYGSGVFFSFDQFVSHPTALALVEANPLFLVLDITRDLLLYDSTPLLATWLKLAAWAAGSLAVGFVFFWHGEESYGRD